MKIEASLKLKDSREASDSGLFLWRRNFGIFLLLFAIPFWITAFLTRIFIPGNLQYLSWLFIWLLKPLFDRIILHIISVRFFESSADLKQITKGMGKSLLRGLAGDLLWRRFSPIRSSIMPVRVLELNINSGKRFKDRKNILEKGGIGYGFFLTIWGISLEAVLLLGQIIFFMTMGELISSGFFYNDFNNIEILIFAAWCVNYMLIESIYVCMGFSLYINSRVNVEGWDIEITFRSFAKKIEDKIKNGILFIFIASFLFLPAKTFAQETENTGAPLETLQEILSSPDFGSEKDAWSIRLKRPPETRQPREADTETLNRIQRIVAHTLRFVLISLIAGFIIFLIIYIKKNYLKKTTEKRESPENILKSLREIDPKLLLEKAVKFNDMGEKRLAWGFCTAAAIQSMHVYHGILFPPNATENDCAQIVKEKAADSSEKFSELIKNWIHFAYAGRFPPENSFNEAVEFCITLGKDNG